MEFFGVSKRKYVTIRKSILSDMSRTVRIDEETYRRLTVHACKLQRDKGKPVFH